MNHDYLPQWRATSRFNSMWQCSWRFILGQLWPDSCSFRNVKQGVNKPDFSILIPNNLSNLPPKAKFGSHRRGGCSDCCNCARRGPPGTHQQLPVQRGKRAGHSLQRHRRAREPPRSAGLPDHHQRWQVQHLQEHGTVWDFTRRVKRRKSGRDLLLPCSLDQQTKKPNVDLLLSYLNHVTLEVLKGQPNEYVL